MDETFIGGKARFMHKSKREQKITGRGASGKVVVIGTLQRSKVPASTLRNALREGRQRGLIRRSELSGAQHKLRDDEKTIQFLRNAAA